MIQAFEHINSFEKELMLKAPILVCILIAGADGNIENKEIKEAITVIQKQQQASFEMEGFFKEVLEDFEDKVKILVQSYPYESTQRNPLITEELSSLSHLWSKIDQSFAKEFYSMLRQLAKKIASSTGGVWGYNAVGAEEAKYLQLSMINPPI